jgi:hypothetical protein
MDTVGFFLWIGIPIALVYVGIAKRHGRLRKLWLGAAGLYVAVFMIVPVAFIASVLLLPWKSEGSSSTLCSDGSWAEIKMTPGRVYGPAEYPCPTPPP